MVKLSRCMQPCTTASRQPGSHVWHCVMRMRLSTPDVSLTRSSCTRPQISPGLSSMDPPTTQGTLRRHHQPASQQASTRVMRKSKTHAQTPRDASFHTPARRRLAGSLASAARGQASSSPDCSSTPPLLHSSHHTPSHSFTGTVYEPAIEDCPAPLPLALLSLPPT
jgi:hypothetical protein